MILAVGLVNCRFVVKAHNNNGDQYMGVFKRPLRFATSCRDRGHAKDSKAKKSKSFGVGASLVDCRGRQGFERTEPRQSAT